MYVEALLEELDRRVDYVVDRAIAKHSDTKWLRNRWYTRTEREEGLIEGLQQVESDIQREMPPFWREPPRTLSLPYDLGGMIPQQDLRGLFGQGLAQHAAAGPLAGLLR